jgi:hypothetical protein
MMYVGIVVIPLELFSMGKWCLYANSFLIVFFCGFIIHSK